MSSGSKYLLGSASNAATTNAEARIEIAETVGFDFEQVVNRRDSQSDHAVYFRHGDLLAILNWLRFQEDEQPIPVSYRESKQDIFEEIAVRCGFEVRRPRMERLELQQLLEHVQEVDDA
ncbi:MAG: hypothetical protein ABEH81_04145 [Halopenitus sp.]